MADDTVVGVRGHGKGGTAIEERARVIIGADGVNSFVARAVRAPEYDARPIGGLLLLLVLQRRPARRPRTVRARPLRVWRRPD